MVVLVLLPIANKRFLSSRPTVGSKSSFMRKHVIVAFLIGFLAVFLAIQMDQKMGRWGDPAPVPVSEVLYLPFGIEMQVTIYKDFREAKGDNMYPTAMDEKQKRIWKSILAPYVFGLKTAFTYLIIIFAFRLVMSKFIKKSKQNLH